MTTISVILATRNRPSLFATALGSVLAQTVAPSEVIVINDGSLDVHREGYARALSGQHRVRYLQLLLRPKGHGQSYVLNYGVSQTTSDYVAFLDDDDCWIDLGHLERAIATIDASDRPVDLYMTHQVAFVNDERKPGPIWIEDLEPILKKERRVQDVHGAYSVTVSDLLRCTGHCHLNTLIVRRDLFELIGGFDEANRWESDRDIYLRLIDCATLIKYAPFAIARHNIPDPAKAASITTALSDFERRLYQLRLLDRAIVSSQHQEIRAYARRHKAFTLKRIAEAQAREGRAEEAAFYAREGLGTGPNLKWAAYTGWQMLRLLTSGELLAAIKRVLI